MRLDHILSKEKKRYEEYRGTLGQDRSPVLSGRGALFNLEGRPAGRQLSGGIAQPGEHLLCKQGVSGSNPLISTRPGRGPLAQLARAYD